MALASVQQEFVPNPKAVVNGRNRQKSIIMKKGIISLIMAFPTLPDDFGGTNQLCGQGGLDKGMVRKGGAVPLLPWLRARFRLLPNMWRARPSQVSSLGGVCPVGAPRPTGPTQGAPQRRQHRVVLLPVQHAAVRPVRALHLDEGQGVHRLAARPNGLHLMGGGHRVGETQGTVGTYLSGGGGSVSGLGGFRKFDRVGSERITQTSASVYISQLFLQNLKK